ncbi:hypothetical protein TCEL_00528 [Thermobrachium celere DSM 8682]|uniref:Uncharacterized protein n=1 Tax=Thermobrachium celere DSM 8682 TaxID=941824 RepID=R7RQI8_9CLOT|nr:hypothetical protein TCEL_00528 [Thermobrachium celere DSM 8682]
MTLLKNFRINYTNIKNLRQQKQNYFNVTNYLDHEYYNTKSFIKESFLWTKKKIN